MLTAQDKEINTELASIWDLVGRQDTLGLRVSSTRQFEKLKRLKKDLAESRIEMNQIKESLLEKIQETNAALLEKVDSVKTELETRCSTIETEATKTKKDTEADI